MRRGPRLHKRSEPLPESSSSAGHWAERASRVGKQKEEKKTPGATDDELIQSISSIQEVQSKMVHLMSTRSAQRLRQLESDLKRAKQFEKEGEEVLSRVDPTLLATMKKDISDTTALWEKVVTTQKLENNDLKLKLTLATKVRSSSVLRVSQPY